MTPYHEELPPLSQSRIRQVVAKENSDKKECRSYLNEECQNLFEKLKTQMLLNDRKVAPVEVTVERKANDLKHAQDLDLVSSHLVVFLVTDDHVGEADREGCERALTRIVESRLRETDQGTQL